MKNLFVLSLLFVSQISFALDTSIQKGDRVMGVPSGSPVVSGDVLDLDGQGSALVFNLLTGTEVSVSVNDLAKTKSCSGGSITTGASVLLPQYGAALVGGVYENGDLLLVLRGNYRRVKAADVTVNSNYVPKVNYCEL